MKGARVPDNLTLAPDDGGGPSQEWLDRARARMAAINALPKELRECVDEYGWTVVHAFIQAGVKNHRHIHHIIRTVWGMGKQGWPRLPDGESPAK